jgi:nitrogen fixation protein FixH
MRARRLTPAAIACLAIAGSLCAPQFTAAGADGNSHETATLPPAKTAFLPSKEEHGDVLTIRGRVLMVDGRPVAGAKVSVVMFVKPSVSTGGAAAKPDNRHLSQFARMPRPKCVTLAVTQSGVTGTFELTYRKSQFPAGERWEYAPVVAEKEGLGANEPISWWRIDAAKPFVLTLVPDLPIHGRIVDLEGKPIARVRVEVVRVNAPRGGGSLEPWMRLLKAGRGAMSTGQAVGRDVAWYHSDPERPITTDADGRFTLTGIGIERKVDCRLQGETIAEAMLTAVTRRMEPLTYALGLYSSAEKRPRQGQIFGCDFTYTATPTQPIVGTVRDAATGKPLANVGIAGQWPPPGMPINDVLRTETDADGHYRLVGLAKADRDSPRDCIRLNIVPNLDQPYFLRQVEVPFTAGLSPVTVDVALHRGVWIEGRVSDKITGEPVPSYVAYRPFLSNPLARKLPEFGSNGEGEGNYMQYLYSTGLDGTFRLPGVPGRGIVGAQAGLPGQPIRADRRAKRGSYRTGVGAAEIRDKDREGHFLTYGNGFVSAKTYNAMKAIDVPAGATSYRCDLLFERGDTINVSLVDPEGQPVEPRTCEINFRKPIGPGPSFAVEALSANESRSVVIHNQARKIGKIWIFKYDPKMPRSVTLTLERCATIKGRLLDEQGNPVKHAEVDASPRPRVGGPWRRPAACRPDGRFECTDLLAGCDFYEIEAEGPEIGRVTVARRVVIAPGKTIDLGEIKLNRRN